jgi:hypothetical protein
MRLHNVARYFDDEAVKDGYSGAMLFKAQVRNVNDSSSTGATLRRRTMSLAANVSVPFRRCIALGSQKWLAGLPLIDTFQGRDIRKTYNLKSATNLLKLLTPGQVCANALGTDAYGHEEYFKDTLNAQTDNEIDTFWNVFMAPNEPCTKGKFLRVGARLLRARQTYRSPEDLLVVQADELDGDWSQSITLTEQGTYNPITETYSGTSTVVNTIQVDVTKFYRWRLLAESEVQPGDRAVFAPLTVTPHAGRNFSMLGRTWVIRSVQAEADAWALHVRPV